MKLCHFSNLNLLPLWDKNYLNIIREGFLNFEGHERLFVGLIQKQYNLIQK